MLSPFLSPPFDLNSMFPPIFSPHFDLDTLLLVWPRCAAVIRGLSRDRHEYPTNSHHKCVCVPKQTNNNVTKRKRKRKKVRDSAINTQRHGPRNLIKFQPVFLFFKVGTCGKLEPVRYYMAPPVKLRDLLHSGIRLVTHQGARPSHCLVG